MTGESLKAEMMKHPLIAEYEALPYALTPLQRQALGHKATTGYAAPPGTGPHGETCGSCGSLHVHMTGSRKRFFKCNLVNWTHGAATDIRMRSPACDF